MDVGKCFYFYLSESEENDTKFLMFAQDRSGFGAVNLMISMVANGTYFWVVGNGNKHAFLIINDG